MPKAGQNNPSDLAMNPDPSTFATQIGFRRARTPWQQDLPALLAFAKREAFDFVDFGPVDATTITAITRTGVHIGTVDLLDWPGLLSPDAGVRRAAVLANAQHIRSLASVGVDRFLTVLAPADPAAPRRDNFDRAVESYRALASAAGECGASILLEGAPGRPPHFANLAGTPADLRAFLSAVDSRSIGVNFDPSHLSRMNVDPVRFIGEFGDRIAHVHAKDVLFVAEDQYDHGTLQQATFAAAHVYGGHAWRYALPGRGIVPWRPVFEALFAAGYRGGVSIELEDADYLGDADREKEGLLLAKAFVRSALPAS